MGELISLVRGDADITAIDAYLEGPGAQTCASEVTALRRRDQARLFDKAADARRITLEHFVPKELAALTPEEDAAADAPIVPDPASILVVYDDMDLDVGRLRLRPHGGHGGQNGMRSIIHRLETDGFPRLRVGIGRSGTDAARHVLSPFSPSESEDIAVSVAQATDALMAWMGGMDLADVMTRFHSRWNQSL